MMTQPHRNLKYYILIFVIFEVIAFAYLHDCFVEDKEYYLVRKITRMRIAYKAVINTFGLVSRTIYDEALNRPSVINILKDADSADETRRAELREQLLRELRPTFDQLRTRELEEMQFVLPDCTSFVRFHKPDRFGDNLADIRSSLRQANARKTPVEGFEHSRVRSGFRYVYPLFYTNEHVGTVEMSVSFDAVRREIERVFPLEYEMILRKDVVEKYLFKDEQDNYIPSDISDDYLYEIRAHQPRVPHHVNYIKRSTIENVNRHIRKQAIERLKEPGAFAIPTQLNGENFRIMFLPVDDIEGRHVAYIISYARDNTIHHYHISLSKKMFAATLFIVLFLSFIYTGQESGAIIRRHRDQLQRITDNMGEGLCVLAMDRKITFANPAAVRILGSNSDRIIGRHIHDIIEYRDSADETISLDEWPIYKGLGQRTAYKDIEAIFVRQDQSRVIVGITSTPLYRGDEVAGCLVVLRDITVRRQAEQDLLRINKAVESASDAIAIVDVTNRPIYHNKAFVRLFGYTVYELNAAGGPSIMCADPAVGSEVLDANQQGHSWTGEVEMLGSDGRAVQILLGADCITDEHGTTVGFVRIYTDITERKQAEEKLRKAKEAAEAGDRAKSDFLSTMSHEIRTPMNGVIGMTGLLMETPLSPEQREYVSTIRTSGDCLLKIINDILDFSKIEAGKLELEAHPFDVRKCVDEVLELLKPNAVAKRIALERTISPDVPPFVMGDVTRVRQILFNLVGNAVKFTHEGKITLGVARDKAVDDRLQFFVRDTGVGIPNERIDSLFRPFSQADSSTTRKYGGTGLGLAITQRLVRLMNGRIWVESTIDEGSTFHFTIQAKEVSALEQARAERRPPSQRLAKLNQRLAETLPVRILIAEDNPVNQKLAVRVLEKMGYAADVAANGMEVLEALADKRYDIIFMDVQMPEVDGLEATRQIVAQWPPEKRPKIIAMTANALQGDREKCLAAGMDDYISKPICLEEIQAALERWSPGADALGTLPPAGDILNLETVNSLREIGDEFLSDLIETFIQITPEFIGKIQLAAQEGDFAGVADAVRGLKGASLNLGAQGLADICGRMEIKGQDTEIPDVLVLIEQLDVTYEETKGALAEVCSNLCHTTPAPADVVAG